MPLSELVVLEKAHFGNTQEGVRPIVIALAGTVLSGGRVVAVVNGVAQLVSRDSETGLNALAGVTLGATLEGAPVQVQTGGRIIDPAFAFDAGEPVFLGIGGLPTQTPPTTGWCVQIGHAESATTLCVRLGQPIQIDL
jgi:hypothetical protein